MKVKYLYTENHWTLVKKLKNISINKYILWLWVEKINIVEMPIFPKAIYSCIAIPIKILMTFLTWTEQTILKFVLSHRAHWTDRAIWRKKNKTGGIMISDFKLFEVIKRIWYWNENIHINQGNRIAITII